MICAVCGTEMEEISDYTYVCPDCNNQGWDTKDGPVQLHKEEDYEDLWGYGDSTDTYEAP